MALQPIYIYEHDRATSRLELRMIHPTRGFMKMPLDEQGRPSGSAALYTWQNGKYHGQDGQEIDESFVPEKFKAEIEANPVNVTSIGPIVETACKFCGIKRNSSQMEAHLIEHVHETMRAAGSIKSDYAAEKSATAKNTHAKIEKE
jgi:hypothetical protein